MKQTIFRKAEELKDKVICIGEGRNLIQFGFKDIENAPTVAFKKDIVERKHRQNGKEKTYFIELLRFHSCTCKHHSVNRMDTSLLCSYVIAIIKALPIKSEYFKKPSEA